MLTSLIGVGICSANCSSIQDVVDISENLSNVIDVNPDIAFAHYLHMGIVLQSHSFYEL